MVRKLHARADESVMMCSQFLNGDPNTARFCRVRPARPTCESAPYCRETACEFTLRKQPAAPARS